MSAITDAKLSYLEILSAFDGPNQAKKRWRMASTAIYCTRAFLSHSINQHSSLEDKISPPLPSSSFVIDVVERYPFFPDIDPSILTTLVKEKSFDLLAKLGGIDGVSTTLKTDLQCGISGDQKDIVSRIEAFGRNTCQKPPIKSLFHFVWDELKDGRITIQLVCGILSLVFGNKTDGVSFLFDAFLVVSISAFCNFRQNRQFEKFSDVSDDIPVEVVRNGRRQQLSSLEVIVGDVVCLKIGDQVPADGLFIDGHSLQVDESSMTGESDHVKIDSYKNPFLYSGTMVADGYAKMVVTSVGMNTHWGEMMSTRSSDSDEQTPLQARIKSLTSSICKIGLVIAFIFLVLQLERYFTGNTTDEYDNKEFKGRNTKTIDLISALVGIISSAVAIMVVAIPEGLPLAVKLAHTYFMKRMMADKAMSRRISACETMGLATTICTDKTGTLTLNQMKLTKFWLGKESIIERKNHTSIARNVVELLYQGVGLNTTCSVYKSSVEGCNLEFLGSPTEKAILSWAVLELEMDIEAVKRVNNVVCVETFNSEKKKSGILTKKVEDDTFHVHWKGAAEMILSKCTHYYDLKGNRKAFCGDERMEFDKVIQGMAASSLRCIAFAHKQVSEAISEREIQENGLTLLGFVGLKDPCRPGVKKAVEDCQSAGVDVKMITGDNVLTAKAIATECGILDVDQHDNGESVIQGEEFRNYTEEERMEKVDEIRVMARSSPLDKFLMVQCLKKKDHVVAVAGDGTNDAQSLKEADIGLWMGVQGTEVAKESSDIVILDDNFASVVTVMKWGRCVYNNIQKFIQFQLTVSVTTLVINFVAAVKGVEVPLTTVQLLWVNLIMDPLGALALAMETPSKEQMEKRPVGRSEQLISNVMWRDLLAQAFYQTLILLILMFKGQSILDISESVNDTLIFNIFVMCQICNMFNARKVEKKNVFKGLKKKKVFVGIMGITVVLQVVMVELLKKFAATERLNLWQWGMSIGIATTSWPIALLVKFIPVPDTPFFTNFSCGGNIEFEFHEI